MTQPPALVASYITIEHYQVQDVGRHNNELFLLGPWELPGWLSGIEATCQCRRLRFDPWVGKIPWRRKWQFTPVSLPGKSRGQRNLAGCIPWGQKGLDMA